MTPARAHTLIDAIAAIAAVAVAVAGSLFAATRGAASDRRDRMDNARHLRDQHQAMVIFANSNNSYLPGMTHAGKIIENGDRTGESGDGSSPAARYWILLDGSFVTPEILINPREGERAKAWEKGPVTTEHYSYALSRIGEVDTDGGRNAEWRDNANSQAVMISDRNTGESAADDEVQSLWTPEARGWRGGILWGDNHADFARSHLGRTTRYLATMNSNDNLFATEPQDDPKVTEGSTQPTANAMMVYE